MTAMVGENVTLPRRTTLPTPVDWLYQTPENKTAEFVCSAGKLVNGYTERFDLDRSTFGDFSLTIHKVTKADAGLYTCIEDVGEGMEHRITLTVGLHVNGKDKKFSYRRETRAMRCMTPIVMYTNPI